MLRPALVLFVVALVSAVACRKPDSARTDPASGADAGAKIFDAECAMRGSAWCASPPNDPCGAHRDVASCRADKRCQGMRYAGESAVACVDDGTGFDSNCPTVGCISR